MGREDFRPGRVDLNDVVKESLDILEPIIAGRDIKWDVGELPAVEGNAILLENVMTNLLSNAIKYTQRRPDAHIEIGSTVPADDRATIFVRDNGVGFDVRVSVFADYRKENFIKIIFGQ